jgi:hypothetical protein
VVVTALCLGPVEAGWTNGRAAYRRREQLSHESTTVGQNDAHSTARPASAVETEAESEEEPARVSFPKEIMEEYASSLSGLKWVRWHGYWFGWISKTRRYPGTFVPAWISSQSKNPVLAS